MCTSVGKGRSNFDREIDLDHHGWTLLQREGGRVKVDRAWRAVCVCLCLRVFECVCVCVCV